MSREIDSEKTIQNILDECNRVQASVDVKKFNKKKDNPEWLKKIAKGLKVEVVYVDKE